MERGRPVRSPGHGWTTIAKSTQIWDASSLFLASASSTRRPGGWRRRETLAVRSRCSAGRASRGCRKAELTTLVDVSRIFTTSFASVYPHYVTKVEKKGRTKTELDEVI